MDKVEEVLIFFVNEGGYGGHEDKPRQHWISVEQPEVTLRDVADSMVRKGGYWNQPDLRRKYASKVCSVLKIIAKSLHHLHSNGLLHGDLSLGSCGKFEQSWKVLGRMDFQEIGDPFDTTRFQNSFPPESLQMDNRNSNYYDSDVVHASFKTSIVSDPSIDIWAFGKLAYETIMGRPLVDFETKKPSDDPVALLEIMDWDERSLKKIFTDLLESGGIAESGAELFTSCLFARPQDRPKSMDEILSHPFWKENQKRREKSKSKKSRRNTDSVSKFSSTSKPLFKG